MYHSPSNNSHWGMTFEEIFAEAQRATPNLSDPSVRLAVITELRKLGYTVEPGGN